MGRLFWAFDWFSLMQERYTFLAVLLALPLAFKRDWRWFSIALAVALLNTALMVPYLPTAQPMPEDRQARILMYNLYYQNDDLPASIAEIKKHNPDVIFLMEYSFDIQSKIEGEFEEYPYRLIEPSRMTMGLVVFSKIPLERANVQRREETRIPVFDVQFNIARQPVNFVAGHSWPPLPQWGALNRAQTREVIRVAEERSQSGLPLIVAGDFNHTQWSGILTEMQDRAQVQDARHGFGLSLTHKGGWLYGLSLDHIFVSDQIQVVNFYTSDMAGSDHTPLILDLRLK
jgi:endonuclease/exonuclease/phosphatase (EEP) superfamily protein YafD